MRCNVIYDRLHARSVQTATVLEFKGQIEAQFAVPPPRQRLIYRGHILRDSRTVGSYGMRSACVCVPLDLAPLRLLSATDHSSFIISCWHTLTCLLMLL